MTAIVILDYGSSNLCSVAKALNQVASRKDSIWVTSDLKKIKKADKIVFPGQGAIGSCISALRKISIYQTLQSILTEKPCLGICLGLQILLDYSEEGGGTKTLGIISGEVKRFQSGRQSIAGIKKYKIPHMGWNQVWKHNNHPLWKDIVDGSYFYFVHSFYAVPQDQSKIAGQTYHIKKFCSAIQHNNIFSTQFHPEKSQQAGLLLLKNFLAWKV